MARWCGEDCDGGGGEGVLWGCGGVLACAGGVVGCGGGVVGGGGGVGGKGCVGVVWWKGVVVGGGGERRASVEPLAGACNVARRACAAN